MPDLQRFQRWPDTLDQGFRDLAVAMTGLAGIRLSPIPGQSTNVVVWTQYQT